MNYQKKKYVELCSVVRTKYADKIPTNGQLLYGNHYYQFRYSKRQERFVYTFKLRIESNEKAINYYWEKFDNDKPTEIEAILCKELKKIIRDRDTFIGTMLMLRVDQPDPDGNSKKLLDFIKEHPEVGYDEVLDKADEIMGKENPFAD